MIDIEEIRPTKAELIAAVGKTVPDVIAPGLRILFVGINPSLYSGATGHHFARSQGGNSRFWPVLYQSGFRSPPRGSESRSRAQDSPAGQSGVACNLQAKGSYLGLPLAVVSP